VAQGKGPEFKPQYYTHTKKDSREKSMKLKSVYGVCVYVCGAVREREREKERERSYKLPASGMKHDTTTNYIDSKIMI
jgi:hypothetical protein